MNSMLEVGGSSLYVLTNDVCENRGGRQVISGTSAE